MIKIYDLETLCQEVNKGRKLKYLFFWGHTPNKDGTIGAACLSQWWMQDFIVDGVMYRCCEQYMMAQKARLFHDVEMKKNIMDAKQPKQMKAYGRLVKNFDANVWNNKSIEIVRIANYHKFLQNEDLKNYLLSTKDKILVEASPRDRIWGIGMSKHHEQVENPLCWRGKNQLGFALTYVKDQLQ